MTEDAAELMVRLVNLGAKSLRVMSAAETVNGFMGATITMALGQVPHAELSAWLHKIADAVDEEGAEQAKHAS